MPRWGLGVWKNLIGGSERVLGDLERLQRFGVPIDAAWVYDLTDPVSGVGWPWQIHDPIPPGGYRDPAGLVDRLHHRGVKALGYLNPFVVQGTPLFAEASRRGHLLNGPAGEPLLRDWRVTEGVNVQFGVVDFADPAARAWWRGRVRHALGPLGLDGAMQDFGEGLPAGAIPGGDQTERLAHNRYPTLYTRETWRAAQQVKPNDFAFFARAGYLGAQAFTTGRFPGDQLRSWHSGRGLPSVVRAMINGSLAGYPYWGPDIAGFTTAPDSVPDERELWTRWVQLGALSPVMRDMLGNQRHAIGVLTDYQTVAVFRAYARLHTALVPELHRLARVAHRTGLPIVRPLFLEHPDEPATWRLDDQYLLGRDLLIAPVLEPDRRRRRLYLPAGRWRHYWSGRILDGKRWIDVAAPPREVPLFIRARARLLPDPGALWAAGRASRTAAREVSQRRLDGAVPPGLPPQPSLAAGTAPQPSSWPPPTPPRRAASRTRISSRRQIAT